MREIKFRAWDKTSGKMSTPWDITDMFNDEFSDTSSDELMQYTGLKDKNGKEIYEGDIVKIIRNGETIVHQVKWGHFEDCCVLGETWILEPSIYMETVYYHHEELEIIGNIYQNPERIKKA